eukprot:m.661222 g.661222  ORF g.661222 m.661222 type:complete len:1283 (+) comp22735_c0_seq3:18-3866(+)
MHPSTTNTMRIFLVSSLVSGFFAGARPEHARPCTWTMETQVTTPCTWENQVPREYSPAPMEPSSSFTSIELLSPAVKIPGYSADTFYPSEDRFGDLYSGFDDGCCDNVCVGSMGPKFETGSAIVSGNSWDNLTVTAVGGVIVESGQPMQGRYTSANFVGNGTWWVGTYGLAVGDAACEAGTNVLQFCEMGPFVGFRFSTNRGVTWQESKWNVTHNLFGERAGAPIKMGAPHVVDHGPENADSPDGALYMVGNGCMHTHANSNCSWISGDGVFLARATRFSAANPDSLNTRDNWEFACGDGCGWTTNISLARPVFTWKGRVGTVTATWNKYSQRYILCITTPTVLPSTVSSYDTYFLETPSLTAGPFRLISYLPRFGQQAYFVSLPSKWLHANGGVLSFSANFACKALQNCSSNIPGAAYGAVLMPIAFGAKHPLVAASIGDHDTTAGISTSLGETHVTMRQGSAVSPTPSHNHQYAFDVTHVCFDAAASVERETCSAARSQALLRRTVNRKLQRKWWSTDAMSLCTHVNRSAVRLRFVCTSADRSDAYNWTLTTGDEASNTAGVGQHVLTLVATTTTAFDNGVRHFLRHARMYFHTGRITIPLAHDISAATASTTRVLLSNHEGSRERWHVRGHQYTAAHHPSMFRTWEEFDEFTEDLKVFGTNQIELAHFTGSVFNIDGLQQFSTHLDRHDMNVSFWWGAGAENMSATSEAFRKMPRIDSIFFPGGDGGTLDWTVIKATVDVLRSFHPQASTWVSAQELSHDALEAFVRDLGQPNISALLTGIVYGPHVIVPLTKFVAMLPDGYLVRQYPDICHNHDCQFEVPAWNQAWSLTHGRQAPNPMPKMMSNIVRLRSNGSTPTVGVGAYSEGLNDDLNKVVWSAMAENDTIDVVEVAAQYARYFFGAEHEDVGGKGLMLLELNWADPIPNPARTRDTLKHFQAIADAYTQDELMPNWRLLMYLQRAQYDAFIAARLEYELRQETAAYTLLKTADASIPVATIDKVLQLLNAPAPAATLQLRAQVINTSALINATVGAEVLQSQDVSLNMDTMDTPLTDGPYTARTLALVRNGTEHERIEAVAALVAFYDCRHGACADTVAIDFLGSSLASDHPRLDNGQGAHSDPSFFYSSLQAAYGYSNTTHLAFLSYGQVFYDTHMRMHYSNLSPDKQYELLVLYSTKPLATDGVTPPQLPLTVATNASASMGSQRGLQGTPSGTKLVTGCGYVLHDYQEAPSPMRVLRYTLPTNVTATTGSFDVLCYQYPGQGGSGRTCHISMMQLKVHPSA